jgi:hypothetical protein
MDEIRQRGIVPGILIAISLIGSVLISFIVIYFDQSKDKYATILVFVSTLPLFATWIGSALAYYFSSSNFAMAVNSYTKFTSPTRGRVETPVTTAMIDKGKIIGMVTLATPQGAANINIQDDLLARLSPLVTRIPVIDAKGAILYIIHENTLHKFIAKIVTDASTDLTLNAATLQDLLNDPELGPLLTLFVIVPSSFTLVDAKNKIDKLPGCQDAFVTQTGKRTESIIGWVTDARVAEFARV